MRNQQVPDDCLKSFRVWGDTAGVNHGNEYAGLGDSRCIAAVAPHDSNDGRSHRFCVIERRNNIRAYISLDAAAADGKDKNGVTRMQAADL
jgi:hypothetical protein